VGSVLQRPEDVFNLGMDEFAALLKERDPSYLAKSFGRWQLLLQAEKDLKRCWTITKDDLPGDALQRERIWEALTYESGGSGYIDRRGFIQDNFRALKHSGELALDTEFEPLRDDIFNALRRPLAGLSQGIGAFEARTEEAVGILESQLSAATDPQVKDYYRAEIKRLRQRVENMKEKITDEGR